MKFLYGIISSLLLMLPMNIHASNICNQNIDSCMVDVDDNPANLDKLWLAYNATKNIIYPEKILEFISKNDDYLLKTAHYVAIAIQLCGLHSIQKNDCSLLPIQAIQKNLKSHYPNQSETILNHVLVLSSALWSMNSMRQQDPQFNKKIFSLCQKKPKLDYLKKLFPEGNKNGYWETIPNAHKFSLDHDSP